MIISNLRNKQMTEEIGSEVQVDAELTASVEVSTAKSKVKSTRINPVAGKPDLPVALKTDPFYDALPEKYRRLVNVTDSFDLELTKALFSYIDVMKHTSLSLDVVRDQQLTLNRVLNKALLSSKDDFNRRQEIILMAIRSDLASDNSTFGGIAIFNVNGVGRALKVKNFQLLLTFYRDVAPLQNRAKVIRNSNLKLVSETIANFEARNRFLAFYGALGEY